MSATRDNTLADPERLIADLQRQLAECKAERDEGMLQQTATAEVLQVINSSPGDLVPVFDAMLDKAMDLCSAAFGYLLTYDGECFQEVAHRGLPQKFAEYLPRMHQPGPSGAYARIKAGAPLVHIADLKEGEVYRTSPLRQALVDLGGARTGIIVALRKDETLLGVLTMYRQEVRRFTDKQVALLQNFAAQAVIAMENARLLGELRQRSQELTRRETALRNSEERYALAMRAINEGVYEWDVATSEMYYSPRVCELVGLQASELRTMRDWTDRIHPDDREAFKKAILAHFKGKTDRLEAEYRYRHADGSWHWAWQHGIALKNGAGRAYRVVGSTGDITDRKAAEQALQEALEQQTATAEVLQVINSSPGDLKPVFDAILEKAHSLCGADFGALKTYDGEFFRHAAARSPSASARYGELMGADFRPDVGSVWARLVSGERFVHDFDLAEVAAGASQDRAPHLEALVEIGIHTQLIVPLRKDDRLLGAISANRREVRPFFDTQIALLENFAAQAVIAMENARLITETREALEQQTATAEVLGVINSSRGDLSPVFDAILEKAHALCGATRGGLVLRDGERFRPVALHDIPEAFAELLRSGFEPGPNSPYGLLVRGEHSVHIADLAAVAPSVPDDPVRRAAVELGGVRTLLMVPLRNDGALLGVIVAMREEVRPFTDKQIALLQNFAAQAVIAMENARLITETREALEQQTATAEVLGVINSSLGDLEPVFEAMLEKALRLCEAEIGTLWMAEGEKDRAVSNRGAPHAYLEFLKKGPHPRPTRAGGIVHIADIRQTEFYRDGHPLVRVGADLGGVRTMLAVPLRKDEVELGRFSIYRTEVRPFSDKQIALLQNFAAQAVIAMENARLLTETREALEQQTATAEVLQVINASPGDLTPVFDVILEKAHSLCEAASGNLLIFDGEQFRSAAACGEPRFTEYWRQNPVRPSRDGGGSLSQLMRGERIVHLPDVRQSQSYRDIPEYRRRMDIGGIRTLLIAPLRKDTGLLGAISAYRQEVRPFSDKQIALLQNFAAQAVIAMENARLLGELRQRTDEVAELNRGLEARVAEQVEELGRVGRLKRFLAPQLAELIVSQGDENILESHRREIVVVFCDLRGYTAFTETAEPEEVLDFLREYHGALGPLVSQYEGTLDQFSGDGIMVFFNDPVPIPDPAERAVNMAVAMRQAAGTLIAHWRERGRDLGFGAGIAQGYATLGQIGFSERSGYTAIGTVCNVAARLCAEAKDGQILLSQRVNAALGGSVATEQIGALALKGLTQPVVAYNVPLVGSQAAFRVIGGGAQSDAPTGSLHQ